MTWVNCLWVIIPSNLVSDSWRMRVCTTVYAGAEDKGHWVAGFQEGFMGKNTAGQRARQVRGYHLSFWIKGFSGRPSALPRAGMWVYTQRSAEMRSLGADLVAVSSELGALESWCRVLAPNSDSLTWQLSVWIESNISEFKFEPCIG